ncbi:hypothetical protein L873DRAFT_1804372 [Choiromyces venosus 120613-1]|uniref:Uncharacterized protein n=1 Tax=Choiromyces venosus 120613-1 TaxID=1336337 RepID=A0A3N4JRU2_9PEZI|nr:hypothetical protein L873DRAFT_1804372 [Choiromyces venosus 120613-1]
MPVDVDIGDRISPRVHWPTVSVVAIAAQTVLYGLFNYGSSNKIECSRVVHSLKISKE